MKKKILKTISLAAFLVFISSCETNEDHFPVIEQKEAFTIDKSKETIHTLTKSGQNINCWDIEKYEGGTVVITPEVFFLM